MSDKLNDSPQTPEEYAERGQILYRFGRYDEALAAYTQALELDPELVIALHARSQLYFERGIWTQALADWNQLIQFHKADENVYMGRIQAEAMREGGNYQATLRCQEAIAQYPRQTTFYIEKAHLLTRPFPWGVSGKERFLACEQALFLSSQEPQSPTNTTYSDKAWALTYLNRYDEALQAWDQAISLDPGNPNLYIAKARMLQQSGRESDAAAPFQQALTLFTQRTQSYPHHPIDLIRQGDLLFSLKRFSEALNAYEQALQLDSASARAYFARGEALFNLHRYTEACAAYEQAIQLDSAYKQAHTSFGSSLDLFLKDERALAHFQQELRANPTDVSPFLQQAAYLLRLKRYTEALETIEQAILYAPDSPGAHKARAEALINLSRYAEAHEALLRSCQLLPLESRPFSERENFEYRLEFTRSIIDCDAILSQHPTDWECALRKIDYLWHFGRYTDASEVYRQACWIVQDDTKAYLGLASRSTYDKQEALRCCKQVLRLDSVNAEAHARQGSILFDLHRYDEALAASERALELDPRHWLATSTSKKIQELFTERKRLLGNLSNAQITYLRQGGTAWNAWRATQTSPSYDLSYLTLRELDLSQADLSSVNLSHSDLSKCNLTGASLYQSQLEATKLQNANLKAADARQLSAPGLDASHADLSGINLRGANLSQANLKNSFLFLPHLVLYRRVISESEHVSPEITDILDADLRAANLTDACWDYALLARVDLREAHLGRILLRYANLREADLSQANLHGASLVGADLAGASLREADLIQADLRGANLAGADLRGANLFQALFDDADLRGVDLSQTISRDTSPPRRAVKAPLFPSTSPMTPPSISAAEMRPGVLTALFHCQAPGCSEVMKLELVSPGTPHEDDQYQLLRSEHAKPASLICDYLPAYSQSWHPSGLTYQRVELALRQGDVAALYMLDDEYTPFYCWRCHGVYCYNHMRFEEVWDDFYPHPDYWTGTCPYGHPTFVNH